jgi:hypothetical protein
MARKYRRRTRKRNKKGGFVQGFLGPKTSATVEKGVQGWKDIGADVKSRAEVGAQGIKQAAVDVHSGYKNKTQPGAGMLGPVHRPPYSPPPMELPMELPMEPTKKKEAGGLLGLGWFGLGGRRLSHSSFINKMLRVRTKNKRNKAIRKYLKGGKKKTKKRRVSKKRRTKRRRR